MSFCADIESFPKFSNKTSVQPFRAFFELTEQFRFGHSSKVRSTPGSLSAKIEAVALEPANRMPVNNRSPDSKTK